MHGMFWSFRQILSICHQTRVLGHLAGDMQRTLAISQNTLVLIQKLKIVMKWQLMGQLAKSPPGAPILQKSRMRALLWLFRQIWRICHQTRVFGHLEVKCNEHLLYLRTHYFLAQVKIDLKRLSCVNCKILSRSKDFAKITHAGPVLVILGDLEHVGPNLRFQSFRR